MIINTQDDCISVSVIKHQQLESHFNVYVRQMNELQCELTLANSLNIYRTDTPSHCNPPLSQCTHALTLHHVQCTLANYSHFNKPVSQCTQAFNITSCTVYTSKLVTSINQFHSGHTP